MPDKTTLERAFELAVSGDYASLGELRNALKSEKYDLQQLTGRALTKQLNALIRAAHRAEASSV